MKFLKSTIYKLDEFHDNILKYMIAIKKDCLLSSLFLVILL